MTSSVGNWDGGVNATGRGGGGDSEATSCRLSIGRSMIREDVTLQGARPHKDLADLEYFLMMRCTGHDSPILCGARGSLRRKNSSNSLGPAKHYTGRARPTVIVGTTNTYVALILKRGRGVTLKTTETYMKRKNNMAQIHTTLFTKQPCHTTSHETKLPHPATGKLRCE